MGLGVRSVVPMCDHDRVPNFDRMINHPYIAKLLVEARIDELRRDAVRRPPSQPADDDASRRSEETGAPVSPRTVPGRRPALAPASDPCA